MAQVQVSLAYIKQQIQKARSDLAQLRVPGSVHGQAFITDFDQVKKYVFLLTINFFIFVTLFEIYMYTYLISLHFVLLQEKWNEAAEHFITWELRKGTIERLHRYIRDGIPLDGSFLGGN